MYSLSVNLWNIQNVRGEKLLKKSKKKSDRGSVGHFLQGLEPARGDEIGCFGTVCEDEGSVFSTGMKGDRNRLSNPYLAGGLLPRVLKTTGKGEKTVQKEGFRGFLMVFQQFTSLPEEERVNQCARRGG